MVSVSVNTWRTCSNSLLCSVTTLEKRRHCTFRIDKTPIEWGKINYLLLDKTGCFYCFFVLLCFCVASIDKKKISSGTQCSVRGVQKRTLLYNGNLIM